MNQLIQTTTLLIFLIVGSNVAAQTSCDFNGDGNCNLRDISVAEGLYGIGNLETGVDVIDGQNSIFDLTLDGRIDTLDLDRWLGEAATHNGFAEPYFKGDTNLNDHVGFGDFNAMSAGFGVGRDWSDGNYRGADVTSFADFLLLSANYGEHNTRLQTPQNVPESTSNGIFAMTFLIAIFRGTFCRSYERRENRHD